MLTDYHLHLRTDDVDATAAEHFSEANAERYRAVADERGIAELGVSEHIYRFEQALDVWRHPFWLPYARDDIDDYCSFVREQTDLRLGIEADFVPGAEDRMANLLEARAFDYVIGSVHFVREGRCGHGRLQRVGHRQERRGDLAALLSDARRVRAQRPVRRAGAPRPGEDVGGERPRPDGDLRRYYELAMDGIVESQIAVELSTAGLRKRAAEMYPAPAFLAMCVEAGAPVALSSDAHRPEDVGADYDQALELLDSLGVGELCVFEGRVRRLEPIGAGER